MLSLVFGYPKMKTQKQHSKLFLVFNSQVECLLSRVLERSVSDFEFFSEFEYLIVCNEMT